MPHNVLHEYYSNITCNSSDKSHGTVKPIFFMFPLFRDLEDIAK